jgi:hypothetical protein
VNRAAYLALLRPILAECRTYRYAHWLASVAGDAEVLEVTAPDGTPCCVEISAVWDGRPGGDIRVIASIDDGGWRAFLPVTESFIIAPDGSFVGE